MKARDVMTSAVVSVGPDTPTREIARILCDHGISAVPVVDDIGAPVGMVSEGDFFGRNEDDREARRDWWLAMLAEGEILSSDFLASLRATERRARDVMAAPVIAVGEDTQVSEIARLLATYRIKRVPVLRDGHIVGIVSRADLVRAVAAGETERRPPPASARGGLLGEALAGLDRRFLHRHHTAERTLPAELRPEPDESGLMASGFRSLMAEHEHQEAQHRQELHRIAAEQRRREVAQLIELHITDESWRGLMHQARQAAERGEKEFMLLRFPSQLCSDGGRAVNVGELEWPATLRGEAVEIYWRWERDLRPHGFRFAARVLDFPGGIPGEIGLFLVWAQ